MNVLLTFNLYSKPQQMGQNQLFIATQESTATQLLQAWVEEHGGAEGTGILSNYGSFTPVISYDGSSNPESLDFQNEDGITGRAWIIMVPDEFQD